MLCIVIKQNKYFSTGTFLWKDEDGYQKVKVEQTPKGWVVKEPYGMVIGFANKELTDAIAEIRTDGSLDPKLKDLILANNFKR